ncbi:MAG TPA: hypothetical protein VH575_26230 [Gemmataceae bacterium]|jgi:hypothetical protein
MRVHRLARCLFCLALLFALAPGCQFLHSYRPVAVLVRDAETKKPIPDAEIHLSYPLTRDSLAPCDSSAKTGRDGLARLRAAPYGSYGVLMETNASGYQTESQDVSADAIQEVSPAHLFEDMNRRPADFVVEMYAEPRFAVELIVPAGYRGLIKTTLQIDENAACPPGQRCFRYEVSPRADVVAVKGPTILRRVSPSDYKARYAGGELLGEKMDLVTVGFRWLKRDGDDNYFVVGTRSEYDQFRRRLAPNEAGSGNGKEWYAEEIPNTRSGRRGRH